MLTLPLVNVHVVGSSASIPLNRVVASTSAAVSQWKGNLPVNLASVRTQRRVQHQQRLSLRLRY